jgi:hypothetical protein
MTTTDATTTPAQAPGTVSALVLPDICWLADSAQYDEAVDLCPTCACAVAATEPAAIVMGGDPARECDSLATCERCGCCLSCTVGGVEIYTDEDWQNSVICLKGDGQVTP